jgi:hypothetical protein
MLTPLLMFENTLVKAEPQNEHITAYERAICYYTLPKVANPVTYGLVAAYALCIIEAVTAVAYGLAADSNIWQLAGLLAFGAMVVLGMVIFFVRALLNDLGRRSALAAARNVPDAGESDDIPDPFSEHLLLLCPMHPTSEVYACVTNEGAIAYYVEVRTPAGHWRISDPQSQSLFEVVTEHRIPRPGIFRAAPTLLGVYAEKKKVASITCRKLFRASRDDIFDMNTNAARYVVVEGCIYENDRLVGRIYTLRGFKCLDLEKKHGTLGVLAYFVATL